MSRTCFVCGKALFYAPYAPEDTAKQACSDPDCVNAHGIIHEAPFDRWEKTAVEYNETTTEKENTMPSETTLSTLYSAQVLARNFAHAQNEVNDFLEPFVRQYVELRREISPNFTDLRDSDADRFVEIDGENFWMTGDESFLYGESYTPMVTLPFAFVADPEKFATDARKAEEERKNRIAAKKKADAQERVDKLKAQLAKAEEALAKATETGDPISTIATRNQAQKLRDDLAQSATPEQG